MDRPIARRSVIAGSAAGLVGLAASAHAEGKPDIQASEHWASKGGVKLYLYRKRAAVKPSEQQPVVLLVHGSSNSSRSSYDLSVPAVPDGVSLRDSVVSAYNYGAGAVDPTKGRAGIPNWWYVDDVEALTANCPCGS